VAADDREEGQESKSCTFPEAANDRAEFRPRADGDSNRRLASLNPFPTGPYRFRSSKDRRRRTMHLTAGGPQWQTPK